jgi:hypothetical protein
LEALINAAAIVLDLKNFISRRLITVAFLERCEADGVTLKNCAENVRE